MEHVEPGKRGGAIFWGHDENDFKKIAKGNSSVLKRKPIVGEVWVVEGKTEMYQNPRPYSIPEKQIVMDWGIPIEPSNHYLLGFLSQHPIFRGFAFGGGKAEDLFIEFGPVRLREILDNSDYYLLSSVISTPIARKLTEAWKIAKEEFKIIELLDNSGIDFRESQRIVDLWPGKAYAMIKQNPYCSNYSKPKSLSEKCVPSSIK